MSAPLQVYARLPKCVPKEFRFDLWSLEFGDGDYVSIPTLNLGGWTAFTAVWRILWFSDYGQTYPRVYDFGNGKHYTFYDISGKYFNNILTISGTVRGVGYAFDPANRWDEYALRWESGDYIRLYRNGVQVSLSSAAYSGTLDSTSGLPHYLGNNPALTRALHGRYAYFALFNRALSLGEILSLGRLSHLRQLPPAVCILPMDEGLGTTVYDASGNGNHGSVVGAEWKRNAMWELPARSGL